jgi:hypothetical protein
MKKQLFKYGLMAVFFLLFCGAFPRELQKNAPCFFAGACYCYLTFLERLLDRVIDENRII